MTAPLDLAALARETRTIDCHDCYASGHRWRHAPTRDDPYYEHETNEPCSACGGVGFVEQAVEPVTLEDLGQ